jgi:hypothetical protein
MQPDLPAVPIVQSRLYVAVVPFEPGVIGVVYTPFELTPVGTYVGGTSPKLLGWGVVFVGATGSACCVG